MIDPRENTPYDPREEIKERLKDCGHPFEFIDYMGMQMVQFNLPDEIKTTISLKQAKRKTMDEIKKHIEIAMKQDEIKNHLPKPSIDRESDIE